MRNRRRDAAANDRAHALRQDMTWPERLLWSRLRAGRLGGNRFRRQEPIGPFVADYCCVGAKLVIEVDGESHDSPEIDAQRQAYLAKQGWRVLRFSNDEVLRELDWVVDRIADAVGIAE